MPRESKAEAERSLPSRGAWIEIRAVKQTAQLDSVAPLTGSVDRNAAGHGVIQPAVCRSPHGERG